MGDDVAMADVWAARTVVALACACVLAGCGGRDGGEVDFGAGGAGDVTITASTDAGGSDAARTSGIVVDVAGAVRRPGVYELAKGARVHEAIAAAGGATGDADTTTLNRAAEAVDGAQILVPTRTPVSDAAASTASGGASPAIAGKVSINSADAAGLDALPGIGPVTAQKIVDDRTANGPFASVEDLDRVPGIGAGTIEQLASAATT